MEIQDAFRNAYMGTNDAPNPFIWSSSMWEAFELGRYMRASGRCYHLVKASRGSTWKCDGGMKFAIHYTKGQPISIERVQ